MNALDIPRRLFPKRTTIATIASAEYSGGWPYLPGARCQTSDRCFQPNGTHAPENRTRGARTETHGVCREYRASAPGQLAACVPMPHFDALAREASLVGWPTDYRADLYVHDRRLLASFDPSRPFFWALRACGTYACAITPGKIDSRNYAWDAPLFVARTFGAEHVRFYVWDGRFLVRYDSPQQCSDAIRRIATGE